jgi:AraC-like DNA-binding protein/ligand-binding sensor protein
MLTNAYKLMTEYSMATGAGFSIHDRNFMPIPEVIDGMLNENNICLFCIKHQKNLDAITTEDLFSNPCKDLHIKAMMESHSTGTTHTYTCPLGFIFWASPISLNGLFSGALLGSGFLTTSEKETCAKMRDMCGGAVGEKELMHLLDRYPRGKPKKIKALSELMFICAQSLCMGTKSFRDSAKCCHHQQSELSLLTQKLKNQHQKGCSLPKYPMDKECKLIEVLSRGDIKSGKHLLNEILAVMMIVNSGQFNIIRFRAIELAVLISRVSINSSSNDNASLENNSLVLKSIQETKNIEELSEAMHCIVDEVAEQINSLKGIGHPSAIKRAVDYILKNFSRKISLEEIASTSGFSAPYFSTMFKEEMGENLSHYLNRLRVEKASALLIESSQNLTEIAHSCGFEDQSWFSKTFKHYTGVTPSKYRTEKGKLAPKIPETGFSKDYLQEINQETEGEISP